MSVKVLEKITNSRLGEIMELMKEGKQANQMRMQTSRYSRNIEKSKALLNATSRKGYHGFKGVTQNSQHKPRIKLTLKL